MLVSLQVIVAAKTMFSKRLTSPGSEMFLPFSLPRREESICLFRELRDRTRELVGLLRLAVHELHGI